MRGFRRRVAALFLSLAAVAAGAVALPAGAASAAAGTGTASSSSAPLVVPALRSWRPSAAAGFQFTTASRIVTGSPALAATAQTFASDLSALEGRTVAVVSGQPRAGDIVLTLDPAVRPAAEGYTMSSGAELTIAGATGTGVFWGTRTVLQLLHQQLQDGGTAIPAGSARDWPSYPYRGIELCNCTRFFSVPWLERLIQDMSYLKLNYLQLETPIVSADHPENTPTSGPLYTPAQVEQVVAYGQRYHVMVGEEVESPGHMDLTAHPSLELGGNPADIDVSNPAALPYVESLIADQIGLFPGQLWYGGGDEYPSSAGDASAYADYPSLVNWVHQLAGPDAPPQDAWILWQNEINSYVEGTYHRTLNVWNDQFYQDMPTTLDKNIVIDYWDDASGDMTPAELSAAGYDMVNVSQALYYTGDAPPSAQSIYDSWAPNQFAGGLTVAADDPHLLGAEMAIWPSAHTQSTEAEEQGLTAPMQAVAQKMWGSPELAASYPGFQQIADAVGSAPTLTTIGAVTPDRVVTLRSANGAVATVTGTTSAYGTVSAGQGSAGQHASGWLLREDSDGLYTITSSVDGRCLAVAGDSYDTGATVQTAACGAAGNVPDDQQWLFEPVTGGYVLRNDSSGQVLTTGAPLTQSYDLGAPTAAQVWRLAAAPPVTAAMTASAAALPANGSVTATLTVTNWGDAPAANVSAALSLPAEVTATLSGGSQPGTLAPGASGTWQWTLTGGASLPDEFAVPHATVSTSAGAAGASDALFATAANLAGLQAWAANFTSGTVTPVSLSTITSGTAVPVGSLPGLLVANPSGTQLYTANQGSNSVSVVDAATGTVTATIPTGSVPAGLALSPDGTTLWVSDYSDNAIQAIDLATDTAGPEIAVADGPQDISVSPDGADVWVPCENANVVEEVSAATGAVVASVPVSGGPYGTVITPDGTTVYVGQLNSDTVTPISTATATAGTPITVGPAGSGPFNITLSPDGKTIAVPLSNESSVAFISTATNTVTSTVNVGAGPTSVAFSPDSEVGYAAVSGVNQLVPILLSTMTAGPAAPTGVFPISVVTGQ